MAEISTIARPYATAIYNLAKENKNLSDWSNMLSLLSNLVSDSQIKDFIADSQVVDSDRENVLLKICKVKIDKCVE
jgi:F-type H+-transporting ATPase subunit delta